MVVFQYQYFVGWYYQIGDVWIVVYVQIKVGMVFVEGFYVLQVGYLQWLVVDVQMVFVYLYMVIGYCCYVFDQVGVVGW